MKEDEEEEDGGGEDPLSDTGQRVWAQESDITPVWSHNGRALMSV